MQLDLRYIRLYYRIKALDEVKERLIEKQHEIHEITNGFTVVDPSGITVQFEIEVASEKRESV